MTAEIDVAQKSEQADGWVYLCEASALDGGDGYRVEIAGRSPLAVFRVEQTYYVTDDTCTHGSASLAEGLLYGCEIECPYHAGRFDLRTGEATWRPCIDPIAVYPAEVRGSAVFARLTAAI
ncbi:MAG: non-heme iron oxygenase ferredoxin subunit [Xanthobacteraceae bacterium]|nr:non-heme iron oxygenase ferredoxin subunit [Xanthobacteraceae bacterium]